tara:strand:- start:10472 stop:16594 length:6123 start_codon:yes stop_codon:yes gene_type:complete
MGTRIGVLQGKYAGLEGWSDIDSENGIISIYEKVDGDLVKIPFSADVEWYFAQKIKHERFGNFHDVIHTLALTERDQTGSQSLELIGLETGAGRVSLNVRGNVNVTGKMVFQDQALTTTNFQESQTTHLDIEQRQNLKIEGKIGDRISVQMDQDSERDFDWENNIRIDYSGKEDDIVQKIEAGNISLSLPGTQLATFSGSNKGLFGLKSMMQFGPVEITSIASLEKTKKEKKTFDGGSSSSGENIQDKSYRKNQYFFIDEAFRNGTDIEGDNGISEILPSFYPLSDDGKHFIGPLVVSEIEVFKSVGTDVGAGAFFGDGHVNPNNTALFEEDKESTYFQRLVRNVDYSVAADLGFIRLTTPLETGKLLAVSYNLNKREESDVFQTVGDLTSTLIDTTDSTTTQFGTVENPLQLKLICPSNPNPSHATWDLSFKNVYFLGTTNISDEGFNLDILYKHGSASNNDRHENGTKYIRLFGLDNADENGNQVSDDLADIYNPNIINLAMGELIFPMLHPFEMDTLAGEPQYFGEGNDDPDLTTILSDTAALYNSSNTQQIDSESKFEIKVEYTNKSSVISLGGFMLVEGSEEIYLNDVKLTRGVDYTIDYFIGSITMLTQAYNQPDAKLEILYEEHELVSFDSKIILGSRAEISLGDKSFLGFSALYFNQDILNEKIEVGYEPTRNFIWDINGKYEKDLDFLTQAVDKLPFIETVANSKFSVEGEFAQVHPTTNPLNNEATGDPNGVAYIDDFESAKRSTRPTVRWRFWEKSSVPEGYNARHRATMFWYNPYSQYRTSDIWPDQQTSRLAGNEFTDILTLNYEMREAHENAIHPDSVWAGITTGFYSGDFNQTNTKFFEIWLNTDTQTGNLSVDLGLISEDQNDNGLYDTEDKGEEDSGMEWGNTLLEDEEDIGLDGCTSEYENGYGGCLDTLYIDVVNNSLYADSLYIGSDLDPGDPNGDDFSYDQNQARAGDQNNWDSEPYRFINGTDGNGTTDKPIEGALYPDKEDLDGDAVLDWKNDYFTFSIELSEASSDWADYNGGYTSTGWRMYRIPLKDFMPCNGCSGDNTWDNIQHMRLRLSGIEDSETVRIAKIELVGNEWTEEGIFNISFEESPFGTDREVDDQPIEIEPDEVFEISVINNEDNPDEYSSPDGVEGEYDEIQGITLKEQSLSMKFRKLRPLHEGRAKKIVTKNSSYLLYDKMKLFVYGKGEDISEQETSAEFFMQLGFGDNYYEISQPVYKGWQDKNEMNIDLQFLVSLKIADSTSINFKNEFDQFTYSDNSRVYVEKNPDGTETLRKYFIRGEPALDRIEYYIVGVRNIDSTQTIEGEVWINELRLSGARKEIGRAFRLQTKLNLADFADATLTYNLKGADFHKLQERPNPVNTTENITVSSTIHSEKILPQTWGFKVPLKVSFNNNLTTPKYNPSATDVLLGQDSPVDSVLTKSKSLSFNTSFSKSGKSDKWYLKNTIDNITLSFNTSRKWASSVANRSNNEEKYGGEGKYSFSFDRDNYVSPLKWMGFIPWLGKKLSETHLYYTPESFELKAGINESLTEKDPRVGDFTSQYNLGLKRNFSLKYKFLENLSTNYSKEIKSDMDSHRGHFREAVENGKPGIITDVTENLKTTFSPEMLSWFKPSLQYNVNYKWAKPVQSTQEGATITSIIEYSSSVSVSPKSIIETVYEPSKGKGSSSGRRRGGRSSSGSGKEQKQEEKKEVKNNPLEGVFKFVHTMVSKIKPVNLTYSRRTSEDLRGVLGSADIPYRLGLSEDLGLKISDEVGTNIGSQNFERSFSAGSGLNLTSRISTQLDFMETYQTSVSGNNVTTESRTRDFLPIGDDGTSGYPFFRWNFKLSGVEKWPLIKIIAQSASLDHAFSGKQTESKQDDVLQQSVYQISLSPVLGISMTMKKGISFTGRYAFDRKINNKHSGINSTEINQNETWTASMSYNHRGGLTIPIFFFRDFNLDNTVNLTLNFDYSVTETRERNIAGGEFSMTQSSKAWSISPRMTYTFTRRVSGSIWYQYKENESIHVGQNIFRDFGFDVNISIQG